MQLALFGLFGLLANASAAHAGHPETVWIEAETLGPLKGANFSFMREDRTTKGSWSVAGPDTAASWTQGGESEWMSVAARADEPGELSIGRDVEVPSDGDYTLWVRYADYRGKAERFGVRLRQGAATVERFFGEKPVVDELDPMKLLWDWAFGWDRATVSLKRGAVRVELFTTGPTGARRCVDALCLTTDTAYRPSGRQKPDHPTWALLRSLHSEPPAPLAKPIDLPPSWKVASGPPAFLWNVSTAWLDELKKPAAERVDSPFSVDPPLLKDFLEAYKGKSPPIYGSRLSGPVWHIPLYPQVFAAGSPFLTWLQSNTDRQFGILLNYGDPQWPAGKDKPEDRKAVASKLEQNSRWFKGYVAGESISYAYPDQAALEARIRKAASRGEVLAALKELNTAATRAKFSGYAGSDLTDAQAWAPVISCLSANMETYCHALCALGVKRIGHENTGNSPNLARRLAFLRGAARQFGAKLVDYQSCNLGDSATMFSREHYFYGASSRYILDNSYDAFAGAGVNWLWKDYFLWHLAGVDAFYNEQGIDMFWKPGGGSAGDDFPVQLSPKGKVAETAIKLAESHPRGAQYTPIAFLLDEAHGWSQERFEPGAFGLDPTWNPALLRTGAHEASIRGWFDVAYFPAPETQNEPASGARQTYVNGIFGDIFDVIVTARGAVKTLSTYRVVVCAGEMFLTEEWGTALMDYVERGGLLVVNTEQLSGPGAARIGLPPGRAQGESDRFNWKGKPIASNRFRYHSVQGGSLATTDDGSSIAGWRSRGNGATIELGVPLGLGIDGRPVPLLGLILKDLADRVTPIRVQGDVEWTLNRLDDGGWLVGILNNRGVLKPQHGITPTDSREAQKVTISVPFAVKGSEEWIEGDTVEWKASGGGSTATVVVPAGATRLLYVKP
jgi:hypothetical protein